MPNIERLSLLGNFSYFNLDNLINLKCLAFNGTINEDFNFELFNNLSRQLQELRFSFKNDYESIVERLFDGYRFSNLQILSVFNCNMRRVTRKFIDNFPALLDLSIHDCHLETIEDDAFSNIKQLVRLNLSANFFKTIGKQCFLPLIKLEKINLGNNQLLESIEKDIFSNMKFIKEIVLSQNDLLKFDCETSSLIKKKADIYFL